MGSKDAAGPCASGVKAPKQAAGAGVGKQRFYMSPVSPEGASQQMPQPAESAAAEGITDADDSIETRQTLVEARWHGQRLDKLLVALAPEF
jgi:hypothetical protein